MVSVTAGPQPRGGGAAEIEEFLAGEMQALHLCHARLMTRVKAPEPLGAIAASGFVTKGTGAPCRI